MEVGDLIRIKNDTIVSEGQNKFIIPAGTEGTICEIHETWAFIEIWGNKANGITGVFSLNLSEFEKLER